MNQPRNDEGYGIFPRTLRGHLTANEIAVYVALSCRADGANYCYPSHATIAGESGMSVRTAQRVLVSLREKGLVEWSQRRGEKGDLTSNGYRLTTLVSERPIPPVSVTPPPSQSDRVTKSDERPSPSARPARRATTIPAGFAPSDSVKAWTTANCPWLTGQQQAEWDKFVDWHTAKGTTYVDWDAAWRTWARRSGESR